jgi:hypothetical protein
MENTTDQNAPLEPSPSEPSPSEPSPSEPSPSEPSPSEPTFPETSDLSYNFIIDQFNAYPTYNNYENVIFNMRWRYIASYTDNIGRIFWAERQFLSEINTDNISSFIPYENLTKSDVQGWIDNLPNINDLRLTLLSVIKEQIKPPAPPVLILPSPF